jgi:hypothetical protein
MRKMKGYWCAVAALTLAFHPGHADAYVVTAQTSVLSRGFGDPNATSDSQTQTNGVTSISSSLSRVTGFQNNNSAASANSFVDLAKGTMGASLQTNGNAGVASAAASFGDVITFDLPAGMSSAQIKVTFEIDADLTLTGSATAAFFGSFQLSAASGPLSVLNLSFTGPQNFQTGTSFAHQTVSSKSGFLTVQDGQSFFFNTGFNIGAAANGQQTGTSDFDASQTASFVFELPTGTIFSSESGVLPAASITAIDVTEPTTLALLWAGLLGTAYATRRRRSIARA